MKFGLSTVTRGVFSSRENYMAVAKAAERAGFDFLSVSDHLVVPGKLESHYPYTASGVFAAAEHGHCFDQLATIAFLAGCTERLRLLTSVLVVPHRPAVLTAKMLATIDVLSNGRLIVGAGAGWMKEEFALLGAPFEDRGKVTDEYLEAFRELWTKDAPAYQRRARELLRRAVLSQARAEAASADLGRRREPGRAAARRQVRRCLVSGQQQPDQAARYGPAPCRRHRRREAHVRGRQARSRQSRHHPARPGRVRLGPAQDPGRLGAAHVHRQLGRHGGRRRGAVGHRREPCGAAARAARRPRTAWRASSGSAPR